MPGNGGTEDRDLTSRYQASLHVVPALMGISRSIRAIAGLKLEAIGVVAGQDQVLLNLDPSTPLTVNQLAKRLAVRQSTISQTMSVLVAKGWVWRGESSSDRRLVQLMLTEAGAVVQADVRRVIDELDGEIAQAMADADGKDVLTSMTKIADLLARRVQRLRSSEPSSRTDGTTGDALKQSAAPHSF